MEKIVFLTNKIFLDESKLEGGVRVCTFDFIKLLEIKFEVLLFPVQFNKSLIYRIKSRLGIDIFEDYDCSQYLDSLKDAICKNGVTKVFINLSSAAKFSELIKKVFGDKVKVILCSHGFEAGDFLHQSVRFEHLQPWMKRKNSAWRLGKILQKELEFRMKYFDLILTVSEIEKSIEYWLGAKKVFFVPRVFKPDFLNWKPEIGRLGFIGDVSHYPNYYGLYLLCNEIKRHKNLANIKVIVIGKNCVNIERLTKEFSFIEPTGYLENDDLIAEVSIWMYFLNPVFYYSKGVSTKLAKGMNWGLPTISTTAGNRGYLFKTGGVVTCDSPEAMIEHIVKAMNDIELLENDSKHVKSAVESFTDYNQVMLDLYPILNEL